MQKTFRGFPELMVLQVDEAPNKERDFHSLSGTSLCTVHNPVNLRVIASPSRDNTAGQGFMLRPRQARARGAAATALALVT